MNYEDILRSIDEETARINKGGIPVQFPGISPTVVNPVDRARNYGLDALRAAYGGQAPPGAERLVGRAMDLGEKAIPGVAMARGGWDLGAGLASGNYGQAAQGAAETVPWGMLAGAAGPRALEMAKSASAQMWPKARDLEELKGMYRKVGDYENWARQWSPVGTLAPAEREAVETYTGEGYRTMNQLARGQMYPEDDYRAFLQQRIDALDPTLRHRTPEPIQAYRGMTQPPEGFQTWEDLAGRDFTDPGFMSVTTHKPTAEDFAGGQGGAVFHLNTPQGVRTIAPQDLGQLEDELIMPRGSRVRVRDVERDPSGRFTIQAHLIPPPEPSPIKPVLEKLKGIIPGRRR